MKRTADLDVKEVNIRIKNITSKKIKGLPEPNDVNNDENNYENDEEQIEINSEEDQENSEDVQ